MTTKLARNPRTPTIAVDSFEPNEALGHQQHFQLTSTRAEIRKRKKKPKKERDRGCGDEKMEKEESLI